MEYFATSFNPSGNRFVDVCGTLPKANPRRLSYSYESVSSKINWIVGTSNGIEFVTVSRDGTQQRLNFDGEGSNATFSPTDSSDRPLLASGTPLEPIIPPSNASITGQAVPTPDGGYLFVSNEQRFTQVSPTGEDVTSNELDSIIDPLLDGHITYSSTNQLWALFNRNTDDRYVHAIMGDDQEGYELHVLKWSDEHNIVEIETSMLLPGDDMVFEQLAPMWADINGDGIDDILVTTSTSGSGAQLLAYILGRNETTGKFQVTDTTSSPYIGTGNRWLHQLAVGPLGPHGETEVVEIRTPHIGGIVRYYRLQTGGDNSTVGNLSLVAETSQYSTHDIGSRNIDMATVADFDGDGIPELVVADQQSNFLYGLQRSDDGKVDEVWKVPLGRTARRFLSSNIAVSCNKNDGSDRIELLMGLESTEILRVSFTTDKLDAKGGPTFYETVNSGSSVGGANFLASLWIFFTIWRISF